MRHTKRSRAARSLLSILALVAGAGLAGAPSASAAPADADTQASAAHSSLARSQLIAKLRGSKEVPGPGDPNGRGRAVITLHRAQGKVCARVQYRKIGKPAGAHIHRGRAGVSGDIVVDLVTAVTGGPNCTSGVRAKLIRKIAQHPRRFYFNIHNAAYPDGAIRGQLHHRH